MVIWLFIIFTVYNNVYCLKCSKQRKVIESEQKTHRIGTERSVRAGGGDWNAVISHSVTVTLSVTHYYTKCDTLLH